jgi:hypothetical protein
MSETRDFVVFALSQDGVAEDEAEAVADAFVETGSTVEDAIHLFAAAWTKAEAAAAPGEAAARLYFETLAAYCRDTQEDVPEAPVVFTAAALDEFLQSVRCPSTPQPKDAQWAEDRARLRGFFFHFYPSKEDGLGRPMLKPEQQLEIMDALGVYRTTPRNARLNIWRSRRGRRKAPTGVEQFERLDSGIVKTAGLLGLKRTVRSKSCFL